MRLAKGMAAALGVLWMATPSSAAAPEPMAADKAILQALEQRRAEMAGSNAVGIAFLDRQIARTRDRITNRTILMVLERRRAEIAEVPRNAYAINFLNAQIARTRELLDE